MTPIWMAHLDHTGTELCQHEHRTRSGAARCLPKLPRHGTFLSFARIVPCNEAARDEEREYGAYLDSLDDRELQVEHEA